MINRVIDFAPQVAEREKKMRESHFYLAVEVTNSSMELMFYQPSLSSY